MYSFLLLKLLIFCSFQFILDVPVHLIFCSFQVIPDVPLSIMLVHFRSFQMFHFALFLFILGHSRCSTLHYFCSFQIILDVPHCIVYVHFRSFQIFHFALFLLISGRSGCSTLHVGHTRIQQTTQWMSSFWILCPWVALISWMGTKCMWSSSQRRRRILSLDLLNWTFKVLTCPYTLFLYFL